MGICCAQKPSSVIITEKNFEFFEEVHSKIVEERGAPPPVRLFRDPAEEHKIFMEKSKELISPNFRINVSRISN